MQTIKHENLKNAFVQCDTILANIEVKGDSVQHLFKARNMLNDLFCLIEEETKEDNLEQKGG